VPVRRLASIMMLEAAMGVDVADLDDPMGVEVASEGAVAAMCDAGTTFLAMLWRLCDFGTEQHLRNESTGDIALVHRTHSYGAEPGLDGGPFTLEYVEGRPVLVGPGNDDDRALHFGDVALARRVLKKRRFGFVAEQVCITASRDDRSSDRWWDLAICDHDAKVLKPDLPEYGVIHLEFYIYDVGLPRAVYINLTYVWEFVFGPNSRFAMTKWLKRYEDKVGGFSERLLIWSQRKHKQENSRKRKRFQGTGHGRSTHCGIDLALELLSKIRVSENKAYESASRKGESKARASALSQYLYSWPLHGRPLGFLCNGVEILVDDGGALDVEFMAEGLKETRAGSH
jgi:hypothetical protein